MVKTWKRWIPAAVVPVVIAGVALAVPFSANAASSLPSKTPQEVIALATGSQVTVLSGTIEQTSNLGLPDISGLGSAGGSSGSSGGTSGSGSTTADAASALELLTGTHTARVYIDGPTKLRVQVLDQLAERDVIRSGSDVWAYDSSKQTAVHTTVPAGQKSATASTDAPTPQTPQQLAETFLTAVDPTTKVTVGADVTVAGRSAYDLVLTPQASDTLVGSVSIAVDSTTGLPLRVEVTATGATDPAFSTEFTSVSLDAPSADLFSFTPPAGTTVTEKAAPSDARVHGGPVGQEPAEASKPTVIGTGWNAIVSIPAAAMSQSASAAAGSGSPSTTPSTGDTALLNQLTTPVAGGRVLQTTLVTVLLTDDGRILAGSVSAEALEAAAAK